MIKCFFSEAHDSDAQVHCCCSSTKLPPAALAFLGEVAALAQINYPDALVPTLVKRNAPKSPAISRKLIVAWGNAMLACLQREESELSVLLADDTRIHELNLAFRQKDRATDVLSFHFEPGTGASSAQAEWLLGDIVISLDTAARQAAGRKRTLEAEVRWLLAHGVLHLCGYDHATPEEKRVMVNETRRLVRAAQKQEQLSVDQQATRAQKRATPRTTRQLAHVKQKHEDHGKAPLPAARARANTARMNPRAASRRRTRA